MNSRSAVCASAIGMKPAIVTSVPVSMGSEVLV